MKQIGRVLLLSLPHKDCIESCNFGGFQCGNINNTHTVMQTKVSTLLDNTPQ